MTLTDPTSTATERTGPTESPHPGQHFKNPLAWIAPPVVFLFVAGALVAGVVFWRKRKVAAKGSAGQPALSDRTENTASRVFEKAELPAAGRVIVEAPGREEEWVGLLAFGDNEISELPSPWNMAELSG
ncbi:hypothetical protein ACMYSQ_008990 [Aspergillus niger]